MSTGYPINDQGTVDCFAFHLQKQAFLTLYWLIYQVNKQNFFPKTPLLPDKSITIVPGMQFNLPCLPGITCRKKAYLLCLVL
jgi:hypothetical protein